MNLTRGIGGPGRIQTYFEFQPRSPKRKVNLLGFKNRCGQDSSNDGRQLPSDVEPFIQEHRPRIIVREGVQYLFDDIRMRAMKRRFGGYLRKSSVQVKDGEGRLLLVQNVVTEDWTIPTGNLELEETFEEGARREVREETGLDVVLRSAPALVLWTASSPTSGTIQVYHAVFVGQMEGGAMKPQPEEVLSIGFFTRDEVEALVRQGKAGQHLLEQWDW